MDKPNGNFIAGMPMNWLSVHADISSFSPGINGLISAISVISRMPNTTQTNVYESATGGRQPSAGDASATARIISASSCPARSIS
jgi:hypothetical protein